MFDLGSILFILALLIAVGAFIVRPLVEHRARSVSQIDRKLSELMAERDRVLDALQDLEMDRVMGKLLEDEYQQARQEMQARGVAVLKNLDDLEPEIALEEAVSQRRLQMRGAGELESALEAAVAQRRATPSPSDAQQPASDGEQEQGGFCPQCGKPIQAGDRFCVVCGSALRAQEPAS